MKTSIISGLAGGALVIAFLATTSVLAGNGVGGVFNLGQVNTVNGKTELEGSTGTSPLFRVDQQGSAIPVEIQGPGAKPPLKVNSAAKVVNLNADRLDGIDSTMFPRAYRNTIAQLVNGSQVVTKNCEPDDAVIGGGFTDVANATSVTAAIVESGGKSVYRLSVDTGAAPDVIDIHWLCADLDGDGAAS
jgi:hypothetical protein